MGQYSEQLDQLRNFQQSGATRPLQWRREQLQALRALVTLNEARLLEALHQDLGKPAMEAWSSELSYITGDIDHNLKHLQSWARPRKVSTPIITQPGKSWIQPEPLGVVLIMAAWNYPLQLLCAPLAAAISAGNTAVLKPSELAPNTAQLFEELLPNYLDMNAFALVQGGVEETTELLMERFDHIMYTGNGQVARIVMAAAARHLTPVTLELGGKSPVYVDQSCNLPITAQRLAWGKFMNAGQTCTAPDYVLTTPDMQEPLVAALENEINAMFGDNPADSDSYARIINQRHLERLAAYLDSGRIAVGGDVDRGQRYIAPTVICDTQPDSALMNEEIFGPILPIMQVDDFDAAVAHVQAGDKPLAAYLFTGNARQKQRWVEEISAGNQCINDVIMFQTVPELPFGGVGESGMGQYSGRAGFENFSHLKSVLSRPTLRDLPLRFAPYSEGKFKWLRRLR